MDVTVNGTPVLTSAPTVTTTGPVVAPIGTGATMVLAFQLVGVATTPLKVTAFPLELVPKFAPLMVTGVPTGPELGDTLLIVGVVPPVPGQLPLQMSARRSVPHCWAGLTVIVPVTAVAVIWTTSSSAGDAFACAA